MFSSSLKTTFHFNLNFHFHFHCFKPKIATPIVCFQNNFYYNVQISSKKTKCLPTIPRIPKRTTCSMICHGLIRSLRALATAKSGRHLKKEARPLSFSFMNVILMHFMLTGINSRGIVNWSKTVFRNCLKKLTVQKNGYLIRIQFVIISTKP